MGKLSPGQLRAKKAWATRRKNAKKNKTITTRTARTPGAATEGFVPAASMTENAQYRQTAVATGTIGISQSTYSKEQVEEFGFLAVGTEAGSFRVLTRSGRPVYSTDSI